MIDVTFTINGTDFAPKLSTYSVSYEFEYPTIIKTIDGTEHYGKVDRRPIITFRLMPLSDAEVAALYAAVTNVSTVVYTDPQMNQNYTANMRFVGSISAAFGLSSINGNRYYKGSDMTFRQLTPR